MNNTVPVTEIDERDLKPDNAPHHRASADAPQLALVPTTFFTQIQDLAKCLGAIDTIAEHLAKSTILPKEMQNAANLKLVLLQGMELGFTPLQAIRASFVITSREGTKVGYYVDALVALVRRSKVCRFFRVDYTDAKVCRVSCARTDEDEGVVHTFELTMQQALEAGMDKKNEWNPDTRQLVQKKKYVWQSAPADMLRARCQGRAVKSVFQDVVFGMYTSEEHEDIAAADALERVPDFQPIPTTPQPRAGYSNWTDPPRPVSSANTHAERKAERRAEDVVDAEIVEGLPIAEVDRLVRNGDLEECDPGTPGSIEVDEGTGDAAWDAIMATLATLSGIDTRGWIPPAFMKLWNEKLDGVRDRDQLKLLHPWVTEMSKGAEKSKACADCAAAMKVGYNTAHSATRPKSEAKS